MVLRPVDSAAAGPGFRLLIRADPQSVRRALRSVHAALVRAAVEDDDRVIAELVLAEVLNNIVEHAYAGRSDGVIEMAMTLADNALACQVIDHGLPFPTGAPPDASLQRHDPKDLPEGGFGWPLIHRLTRDLGYRRARGRNLLSFRLSASRQA